MNYAKRFLSIVLALSILGACFAAAPVAAGAEETAQTPLSASINLGDYVEMGTYGGLPILWRCVAFEKISGYDNSGNPITDSTDTVTEYQDGYLPLMLADTPICQKAFDAAGSDTSGSHGRDSSRENEGSNYWGDSNIRDWLNSSASAGNVVWSCGNPPSSGNVTANPYDAEAGFLTNFTDAEKAGVKTVTRKSLLTDCDKGLNTVEGATEVHQYGSYFTNMVKNYASCYAESITDTIFLLDVQQAYNVYENDSLLGGNSYYGASINYWFQLPYNSWASGNRGWTTDKRPYGNYAYDGTYGIRPAFYLNLQSVIFPSGGGASDNPYKLTFPDQTYTGSAITLDVTIKDGNTTLTEGADYTVAYENNTNVGSATVTITGIGNYTGTVTTTFNIVQAAASLTEPTAQNEITYGAALSTVALPNGWAWTDGNAVPSVTNSGYEATYAVSDDTNYDWSAVDGYDAETHTVTRTVSVTVSKAEPSYIVPTGLTAAEGQILNDVTLPDGWAWDEPTTDVGAAGEQPFPATFTPADTANYNTVKMSVTVTVGHTWQDATCTAPKTCSVCGATEGEALGHDWGEWAVTTKATCTEAGEEQRVCQNDASHVETQAIPAAGHTWGEWAVAAKATCTEAGEEQRVCQNDASHVETQAIPATGHDWGEWAVTAKATCTEAGEEQRVCQNDASHVETQAIPATGHDWGADWSNDDAGHWHECQNEGCPVSENAQKDGYAAHTWDEGEVTTQPTETETGVKTYACTVCGATRTESLPVLSPAAYTVTFDSTGGSDVAAQTVTDGEKATQPDDPSWDGYVFGGWYTDTTYTEEWDFDAAVTADLTLYAKWTAQPSGGSHSSGTSRKPSVSIGGDGAGGTAAAKSDGTVTITPTEGYEIVAITVNGEEVAIPEDGTLIGLKRADEVAVTFGKIADQIPVSQQFTDMPSGAWYEDAAQYVVDSGLMIGTSAAAFAPELDTSRAMIATILWRLEGSPEVNCAIPYDDVSEGTWYTEAVRWDTAEGVVEGYGNGLFAPDAPITREQLAAMLYRYAGSPAASGALDSFTDVANVSDWAADALTWAVERGIITGKGNGILDPQAEATRAEAAAMIQRYVQAADR